MKKMLSICVLAAVLVAVPAGAREVDDQPSFVARLWEMVTAFILPGKVPPPPPATPESVPPEPPPGTPSGGAGDGGHEMDPYG